MSISTCISQTHSFHVKSALEPAHWEKRRTVIIAMGKALGQLVTNGSWLWSLLKISLEISCWIHWVISLSVQIFRIPNQYRNISFKIRKLLIKFQISDYNITNYKKGDSINVLGTLTPRDGSFVQAEQKTKKRKSSSYLAPNLVSNSIERPQKISVLNLQSKDKMNNKS